MISEFARLDLRRVCSSLLMPPRSIPELNALAASRKWAERELDELVFQQQHAAAMAEWLRGLGARLVQEWERLDVLPYDERRAKLREFNVAVTLWKRDHEPRFAIDWAFDPSAWDVIDEEEAPWVIYTTESSTPSASLVNSSA